MTEQEFKDAARPILKQKPTEELQIAFAGIFFEACKNIDSKRVASLAREVLYGEHGQPDDSCNSNVVPFRLN